MPNCFKRVVLNPELQQVYSAHQQALLGFILKRVQDDQLAEDLLHDLYLKLKSIESNTSVNYPKAYIYRMANNLIIDHQRRTNKSPVILDECVEETDIRSPELTLIYQEQLKIVATALKDLPAKTQDVFKMQRIQEIEKKDVAKKMGISVNMVEKHLRRAVEYCRERLKNQ